MGRTYVLKCIAITMSNVNDLHLLSGYMLISWNFEGIKEKHQSSLNFHLKVPHRLLTL